MPSLEDVANDIRSILEDVKTNTSTIKGHTNSIKNDTSHIRTGTNTIINKLDQLDTDVKDGFTNLSQGVQVLIALGLQSNQLMAENNEQNKTAICWLTNIANTLCDVKHNTDKEVVLQTDISSVLHHIDDIGEIVNARAAVEVGNRYEIEARLDECCPPDEEPLRPCFDNCESPKARKYGPVKTDWKPVVFRKSKSIE